MNKFEKMYNEEQELRKAFYAADEIGDEEGMEKARAAYKAWNESYMQAATSEEFAESWLAYKESRNNGNDELDLKNITNAEKLIACLKENGIKKFTFSSTWSDAIEVVWKLQQAGCKMVGVTEIKGRYDFWTEKREVMHALVFEIA